MFCLQFLPAHLLVGERLNEFFCYAALLTKLDELFTFELGPLLEMILWGILYLVIMFLITEMTIFFAMIVASGSASIHLVKQSIATIAYLTSSFDIGSGLIRSKSYTSNDHGLASCMSS